MQAIPRSLRRRGTAVDVEKAIAAEFANLRRDNKQLAMQIYYIFQLANTRAGREAVAKSAGFAQYIVDTWRTNYIPLRKMRLDMDCLEPLYSFAWLTLARHTAATRDANILKVKVEESAAVLHEQPEQQPVAAETTAPILC